MELKTRKMKNWKSTANIFAVWMLIFFIWAVCFCTQSVPAATKGNAAMSLNEETNIRLPLGNDDSKMLYGHFQFNYTGNWNYFATFNAVTGNVEGPNSTNAKPTKPVRQTVLGKSYTNSSSGKLTKGANAEKIVKAYLIWETRKPYSKKDFVNFIAPNKKTANEVYADYAFNDNRKWAGSSDPLWQTDQRRLYVMAADVTSFVKQYGYGTYYVADIPEYSTVDAGGDSVCSWQLVVLEQGQNIPVRAATLKLGANWRFGDAAYGDNDVLDTAISLGNARTKNSGTVTGQVLFGCANDHDAPDTKLKEILYTKKNSTSDTPKKAEGHILRGGGLYQNGLRKTNEYGMMVDLTDISGLGTDAKIVGTRVENIFWNTMLYIGTAVDIESPVFTGTQRTTVKSGTATIRNTFKNISSNADTGIYDVSGKPCYITVNVDPKLTITSASATGADGNAIAKSKIAIDNTNHTVTIMGVANLKKGNTVSYQVDATYASDLPSGTEFTNSDAISGNMYASGAKTGIWMPDLAGSSSKGAVQSTFEVQLHSNSPTGTVNAWYVGNTWTLTGQTQASTGQTYGIGGLGGSAFGNGYIYKTYDAAKSYSMPQSKNISVPNYHIVTDGVSKKTGWWTTPSGTGTYINIDGDANGKINAADLAAYVSDDGILRLYARWEPDSYKVTLHAGAGIESVSGEGTYRVGDTVTVSASLLTGYHFLNWTGTLNSTKQTYSFPMPAHDVDLTANGEANRYTIVFDPNSGAEVTHIDNIEVKYGESITLPDAKDAYVKYTLDGVNITQDVISGAIVIQEDGSVLRRGEDGSLTAEDGTVTMPDGTIVAPDGTITAPDGTITAPDGTVTLPDGTITAPDGTVTSPDGTVRTPDGAVIMPNGTVLMPDGSVTMPDGTVIPPGGTATEAGDTEDDHTEEKESTEKEGSTGKTETTEDTEPEDKEADIKKNEISRALTGNDDADKVEAAVKGARVTDTDTTEAIDAEPQPTKRAYASVFLGWSLEEKRDDLEPQWTMGVEIKVADLADAAGVTDTDGAVINLYAIWDDCPWIQAINLYYTLEQAQSGFITQEEILSHQAASDREDGSPIPAGTHENGTSFTIPDYASTEFTDMQCGGGVSENLTVVDSVGSTYIKQIMVYVVDTTPTLVKPEGYTRFINEKYFNETYENGGLEPNSIWKTDPEYRATLLSAFNNLKNDTPIMRFVFSREEIEEMKQYVTDHGIGNSKEPDALQNFYDRFMAPNRQ